MLRVTIDIFSGFPNPTAVVGGAEAEAILREIALNRGCVAATDSGTQRLGYRGVEIELLSDDLVDRYSLPSHFRLANGATLFEQKGNEIAERLIRGLFQSPDYSPTDMTIKNDSSLMTHVLEQLGTFPALLTAPSVQPALEGFGPAEAQCYYEYQQQQLPFWNQAGLMPRNNCYNYATNRRTNTFAQPGRYAGSAVTRPATCEKVYAAVVRDGGRRTNVCFPDVEKPRWLAALVFCPANGDYHWYRFHGQYWGHKMGPGYARITDESGSPDPGHPGGALITDPRACNRGPYTQFCGFYYFPKSMQVV